MRISDWSSDVCSSDLPPDEQRQDASDQGERDTGEYDRGIADAPQCAIEQQEDQHEAAGHDQHQPLTRGAQIFELPAPIAIFARMQADLFVDRRPCIGDDAGAVRPADLYPEERSVGKGGGSTVRLRGWPD